MRRHVFSVIISIVTSCALNLGIDSAASEEVERPRLFFGPEDTESLRAKATREPFRSLLQDYLHILNEAGGFLDYASTKGELLGGLSGIGEDVARQMDLQLAAVAYVATNDRSYAARAKELLLAQMQRWEDDIPKAGRGAALGVSRHGQIYCWVYDFIQPSGLFTADQEQYVPRILAIAMTRLMERGETFNPFDYRRPTNNRWSSRYMLRMDNYNSDRVMALGLFALTFPKHPSSEPWLTHALEEFDWQMDNSLMPDGSWKEAPRYHGAVMRGFLPFAYALKRNKGINLFEDKRFKGMFESLIRYQTPRDSTMGNVALTPGIADANWENVWESFLGWGAAAYKELDPALAGQLIWAWQRAGSPLTVELSPANQMAGLVFVDDSIKPALGRDLTSENLKSGYTILRNAFDTPDESYFLLSVATHREHLGHHQWDNGSFSLYAFSTPLTVDPGSRNYSLLDEWYGSSKAHNAVVFDDQDIRVNGSVSHFFFDEPLEYVAADFSEAVKGNYSRRVFFIKPHFYLIWDDINSPEEATYHLHVLTEDDSEPTELTNHDPQVQRLQFDCQNETQLEVVILSPHRAAKMPLAVGDDPHPVEFFAEREHIMQLVYKRYPKWLQIRQTDTGQDFVTVLYPKKRSSEPLELLDPPAGKKDGQASENDPRPAGRTGSTIEFKLGSTLARFFLGSAEHGQRVIDADAAVIVRDVACPQSDIYLINGKRLETEEPFAITVEPAASLVVRTIRLGRAYQIRVLGEVGGRLKISAPWKSPLEDIHVFEKSGRETNDVQRHAGSKCIELTLHEREYWLLAEPLRPESVRSELRSGGFQPPR